MTTKNLKPEAYFSKELEMFMIFDNGKMYIMRSQEMTITECEKPLNEKELNGMKFYKIAVQEK